MTAAKCDGITELSQGWLLAGGSIMRWALVGRGLGHVSKAIALLFQPLLEQAQLFLERQDFLLLRRQGLIEAGNSILVKGKLGLQLLNKLV